MPKRYTEIVAGGRSYRLDRQEMALFKEKAELHHVTSQNIQLLELFVSHPKHALVTRSQVFQHLYADKAVTNEAVDLAIKSLRKALGPGFIVTDHRKGYRLSADIRHFEEVVGNEALPPPPISSRPESDTNDIPTGDKTPIATGSLQKLLEFKSRLSPLADEHDIYANRLSEVILNKEKPDEFKTALNDYNQNVIKIGNLYDEYRFYLSRTRRRIIDNKFRSVSNNAGEDPASALQSIEDAVVCVVSNLVSQLEETS